MFQCVGCGITNKQKILKVGTVFFSKFMKGTTITVVSITDDKLEVSLSKSQMDSNGNPQHISWTERDWNLKHTIFGFQNDNYSLISYK